MMKIILLRNMVRLGRLGEEVQVAGGYARNYLIPQGFALRSTAENRRVFEAQRAAYEKHNNEHRDAATKLVASLRELTISHLQQATEDGRLFGSVRPIDIAALLKTRGFTVDYAAIRLDQPIKALGVYLISVVPYPDIETTILLVVARTESESKSLLDLYHADKKASAEDKAID
jgi:large subunit ribosomal protein L9